MATDVADALRLDRVFWIPAGDPPHKSGALTSGDLRLEMVRAATASDPRFEVCTLEIDRPGPSYTIDTIRELRRSLPDAELFLILGNDQFKTFATWRDPDAIVRDAKLAVMDRAGERAAEAMPEAALGEPVFVPVRRIDVSGTEIRSRRQSGGDVSAYVQPTVHAIIAREGLYSGS